MLCRDLIGLRSLFGDCCSGGLPACCPEVTCLCRSCQALFWVAGSYTVLFAHCGAASPADNLLHRLCSSCAAAGGGQLVPHLAKFDPDCLFPANLCKTALCPLCRRGLATWPVETGQSAVTVGSLEAFHYPPLGVLQDGEVMDLLKCSDSFKLLAPFCCRCAKFHARASPSLSDCL